MKKLATFAIMFAAVAIIGTVLTGAATDEKVSSSHSVSSKASADSTKPYCQAKESVLAKTEACSGETCQTGDKATVGCKLCAMNTAKSDDKAAVVTSAGDKSNVCNEGQCNSSFAGKKQRTEGDASRCGGKCDLDEATVLASATDALKCKDCPEGDCKGDCTKCAATKPATQAASASIKQCEFCTEEICKQERTSCAEARKESAAADSESAAAHGPGKGMVRGRGMGHRHAGDSQHDKDHQDFFFLIEHRDSIRRTVKNISNGIESLTESDVAEVADMIQVHVEAMYDRVDNGNPIRMRDPIFRAIFANADKIKMNVEHTEHGVRVRETSTDAYVVKLLQEHAKVVSLWIKNGYAELPKNHAAPQK